MKFLFVGLGGGLGAILRYMISCIPYRGSFPVLTLATNITGAVLIGLIVGLASRKNMPANAVLFLKTGVCGGYTTFSTFSLEAYQLFQNGSHVAGGAYLLLSVAGCLAGVWLGMILAETVCGH